MSKSTDDEACCGSWQMMAGMVGISQNGKKTGTRHSRNAM